MRKAERNAPITSRGFKQLIEIIDKPHHFHLMVFQTELPFFYLTRIHQLIDQPEDTLRVLIHERITALMRFILILLHQFHKRTEDKRHRRTYFMTDIHEKLNPGLIQFLFLAMLFKNPFGFEVLFDLQKYHIANEKEKHAIDHDSQWRQVPYRMHLHRQFLHIRRLPVCLRLYPYAVGSRLHVHKRYAVLPMFQGHPFTIIDTIPIGHARIAERHRGKLYTERFVMMGKVYFVRQRKPTVDNRIMPGTVTRMNRFTVDVEIHDAQIHFFQVHAIPLSHIRRAETSQPVDSSEIQQTVLGIRSLRTELIALQPVFDTIIVESLLGRIEASKPVIRTHPHLSAGIPLYAAQRIRGKPVCRRIRLHTAVLYIETYQTGRRSHPNHPVFKPPFPFRTFRCQPEHIHPVRHPHIKAIPPYQ